MTKIAAFLLVLATTILFPAASTAMSRRSALAPTPAASQAVAPAPLPSALPGNRKPYYVVDSVSGSTAMEGVAEFEAADTANEVMASDCFAQFMLARKFTQLENMSNAGVLKTLRDHTTHVDVVLYSNWLSRVVGQTSGHTIRKNRKYFAGASRCDRASNDAHEVSHILGYSHSYNPTRDRPFSVPYSINAAFEVCCSNGHAVTKIPGNALRARAAGR